ncbi:MAG: pyruvate phosphate dikinase, pyruvate,orthophosphate dikinase [Candidatus Peregrinibacteria bacterium GW2011_GWF2_39_17]|nr:MAG: pyruvate phosphate dikinase, pyruvate,orthophosphate dikinase [Candidatus Peregrinibacteria bacterium GW2011_GWF2_39_17]HCW32538.1 pyruvate, phosphate dikinase [Candidatus Peregrinibacteria bacterium]
MKYIFPFSEGSKDMKELLGGKGANLAEMTKLGLPVPPGFTITTETCNYFLINKGYPSGFQEELKENLAELELNMSKNLGDGQNPLLVSVRSGAKISMPGMMDTVLNLGLNDTTVLGLISNTQNERFCYDAYRRFVQMFGNVVLGVDHDHFEEAICELKEKKGIKLDTELTAENLKSLVQIYKEIIQKHTNSPFPEQPSEQLRLSIEAVFNSWNNKRACTYRNLHGIPHNIGTAVNIQAMVFGNKGEDSGTGVAFTRNPSTGEKIFYGEYLINAQGEDVVAGIRTPVPLDKLKIQMPTVYEELVSIKDRLENHYHDMQDIEFTVEQGRLFILQTRNGKRTAHAAVRIATEMVKEGLIDKHTALLRVEPNQLKQLLHPSIDPKAKITVIAKGLPASPGAATGKVIFTADEAYEKAQTGDQVILVRKETSPEDIHGMHAAQGILTSTGGNTSHAAVVCRGMGKCCVAGCGDIIVNGKERKFTAGEIVVYEGDIITLNGTTGEVILGEAPMCEPELDGAFRELMQWTDDVRTLKVRANADTPEDAKVALEFGAEGIGLCRTEHMFFAEERIPLMREMILSKDNPEARKKALDKLLPIQKQDFAQIFEVMKGLPVTIRLFDPPLHEFLPDIDQHKRIQNLATELNLTIEHLKDIITNLHEVNPMLGHRGCRLGITYPELYAMQVRAILTAAIECHDRGLAVHPEIEVPLIGNVSELKAVKKIIQGVIEELKEGIKFEYKIGTMIELPRACLTADEIAPEADFFSFGTNDLTQMTYGFSRDDVGTFLPYYLEKGILVEDPTSSIDQSGVGFLMKTCVKLGRQTKENLEIGICGEHGGDPKSIEFCHEIGLNYVSCSPYRVPIARLAAAQATLKH